MMAAPAARERFEEFDIGRALAILGLPVVHVLEEADILGMLPEGFLDAHIFLLAASAFGAPLFMACMGGNMVFSRHATPAALARRGVELLIMGILLNVARFGVPDLVFGTIAGGNYDGLSWWPYELAGCDIYDFAGLCFLAFALFKKLRLSPAQILAAAALCLVVGAYLLPAFFANPEMTVVTRLLGRLFWVNEASCFPLLTWLIFPACGYAFGSWFSALPSDDERTRRLRRMLLPAAVVFIATAGGVALCGLDPLIVYASPANSYITDVPNVLMVASSLVLVAYLLHVAATRLQGTRLLGWFVRVSKGIIPYYVAQWVIVGWLELAMEDLGLYQVYTLNEATYWLLSAAIILASLQLAKAWLALKAHRKSKRVGSGNRSS